jgi:hypothetical protein
MLLHALSERRSTRRPGYLRLNFPLPANGLTGSGGQTLNSSSRQLKRVVARHPLVRKGMSGPGFVTGAGIADLVQDLYLELLRKGRFGHYLTREMTDLQIEREILNLELSNILTGRSAEGTTRSTTVWRVALAKILEADPRFRRFGAGGAGDCRIPERLYGLAAWDPGKQAAVVGHDRSAGNKRYSGLPSGIGDDAEGGSQVVISTDDLGQAADRDSEGGRFASLRCGRFANWR